jgi:hypothetical protein
MHIFVKNYVYKKLIKINLLLGLKLIYINLVIINNEK